MFFKQIRKYKLILIFFVYSHNNFLSLFFSWKEYITLGNLTVYVFFYDNTV